MLQWKLLNGLIFFIVYCRVDRGCLRQSSPCCGSPCEPTWNSISKLVEYIKDCTNITNIHVELSFDQQFASRSFENFGETNIVCRHTNHNWASCFLIGRCFPYSYTHSTTTQARAPWTFEPDGYWILSVLATWTPCKPHGPGKFPANIQSILLGQRWRNFRRYDWTAAIRIREKQL